MLAVNARRLIAAGLLASLMYLSVPAAFGSLAGMLRMAHKPGETAHSGVGHHSCCPGRHAKLERVLFVAATPLPMPCGNHLPCCMKRSPVNATSIPKMTSPIRPGLQKATVVTAPPKVSMKEGWTALADNFFPDYPSRSVVLRI